MSHKVQSEETTMLAEHADCAEKALKEAFPDAQILKNEIATVGGRGIQCAFVVRRKNGYDIGLEEKADCSYEVHTYEPGYGNGRSRINNAMRTTRIKYQEFVMDKFGRKTGMRRVGAAKEATIKIDGKERKMMKITLRGGTKSGKKKKGKVMY